MGKDISLSEALQKAMVNAIKAGVRSFLSHEGKDIKRTMRPIENGKYESRIYFHRGRTHFSEYVYPFIENNEEIKIFKDILLSDCPDLTGMFSSPGQAMMLDATNLLVTWICRASDKIDLGKNQDEAALEIVNEINYVLKNKKIKVICSALLAGLQLPDNENLVFLDKNLWIRKLSYDELEEISSHDVYRRHSIYLPSDNVSFIVEKEIEIPLSLNGLEAEEALISKSEDWFATTKSLVNALHLVSPGTTDALAITHRIEPDVFGANGGVSDPLRRHFFYSLILDKNKLDFLKKIYPAVAGSMHVSVRNAINRLSDSESRLNKADILIDAVIGLELLLKPSAPSELSFRVALNYAFLGSPAERRARFDKISDVFLARNKIVHGGGLDTESIHANALNAQLCLRDAITRFLSNPDFDVNKLPTKDFWLNRIFSN